MGAKCKPPQGFSFLSGLENTFFTSFKFSEIENIRPQPFNPIQQIYHRNDNVDMHTNEVN